MYHTSISPIGSGKASPAPFPSQTAHEPVTAATLDLSSIPAVAQYRLPGAGNSHWISALCIAALLGLWWLATARAWISPLFLPSPQAIGAAFSQAWSGNIQGGQGLVVHLQWSALRVFGAFFLAVITAVPIGIAMGVSRLSRGVFDPLIEFYRPLPPLAYLPLIVIWFGIDETSKIILIYLACFAPIALAAKAGVKSASIEQINAALSLGASRWQLIRHVIVPAALPDILVGLRIAIGFGWTTLVAAEMVAATVGLGQMVLNASNFLRTEIVIMGILVMGLLAWCFDLFMRWAESQLVPWKGRV